MPASGNPGRSQTPIVLILVVLLAGLTAGLVIGRMSGSTGVPQSTVTAIQQTRAAESLELSMLRTQVAGGVAPAPAATRAPGQVWTFAATAILPVPSPDELTPAGQFISVTIQITNHGATAAVPPVSGLTLVDEAGNRYAVNESATRAIIDESYDREVDPGATDTRSIMFDVGLPTGIRFILESADDPGLQAPLMIEAQG